MGLEKALEHIEHCRDTDKRRRALTAKDALNVMCGAFRAYHDEQEKPEPVPEADKATRICHCPRCNDAHTAELETPVSAQDMKLEAGGEVSGYGIRAKSGTVIATRNNAVWVEFERGDQPIPCLKRNLKVTKEAVPEDGDFIRFNAGGHTGQLEVTRLGNCLSGGYSLSRKDFTIICKGKGDRSREGATQENR